MNGLELAAISGNSMASPREGTPPIRDRTLLVRDGREAWSTQEWDAKHWPSERTLLVLTGGPLP